METRSDDVSSSGRDVRLAYLAVLQTASDRAARLATTYFTLRLLLSVVLLALSIGIAQSTQQIAILGESVRLAPTTILFIVSVVVLLLLLVEFPQYERAHLCAYKAVRLYDELGFPEPWRDWKTGDGPWGLELVEAAVTDPAMPRGVTDVEILVVLTALALGVTFAGEVGAFFFVLYATGAIAAVGFAAVALPTFALALRRYWIVVHDVKSDRRVHLALGKRRRDSKLLAVGVESSSVTKGTSSGRGRQRSSP